MILVFLSRVYRRLRTSKRWGLCAVSLMLAIAILGNSTCFYYFEHAADPECQITVGDSLWYSIVSITTIGYGDFSAKTVPSRMGTVFFVIAFGLTAFSLFFGMLIDTFTELALRGDRGMAQLHTSNHILIVHFPSEARVRQLIRELQAEHKEQDIVIVSDQIESLPFQFDNVLFVRGSSVSEETYQRAAIQNATQAIVLATSYQDNSSDAVVASAASVIDHLKPEIHLVVECLDDQHRMLFRAVRADAIVSAMRITGNLLVQESRDPGISQLFDIVTSTLEGDTLFSAVVAETEATSYGEWAKQLLDRNVNIIAVTRNKQTFTNYARITPLAGDHVIFLAEKRKSWPELKQLCRTGVSAS